MLQLLQSRLLVTLHLSGPVSSAAFSPDGEEIVTAGQGGSTRIWSVTSSHHQLGRMPEPGANLPPGSYVSTAAFSPDGKEIVTASEDGTARIWNVRSQQ